MVVAGNRCDTVVLDRRAPGNHLVRRVRETEAQHVGSRALAAAVHPRSVVAVEDGPDQMVVGRQLGRVALPRDLYERESGPVTPCTGNGDNKGRVGRRVIV